MSCRHRAGSHLRASIPYPLELDLSCGEITTVLWATGFRPDQSWLDVPVRDRNAPPPTSTAQVPAPAP